MCSQKSKPVADLTKDSGATNPQAFEFHPSTLAAQVKVCVSATYENGKICVNFPVVGDICFDVSLPIPEGTSVKVCMESCGFKFGIPPFKGIKATVYLGDDELYTGVIWGTC